MDMFEEDLKKKIQQALENTKKPTEGFYVGKYIKKYFNPFTDALIDKIKTTLQNNHQFLLIEGHGGSGKSDSIKRVCDLFNYELITYDSSREFDDNVRNELKTVITSVNNRKKVLVFEDAEDLKFPNWFYSRKDDPTKSFLDFAMEYYMRFNFFIIFTTRNKWSVPFGIRSKYVQEYAHSLPHMNVVKSTIRNAVGVTLPAGFPKDLHQIHLFLKFGNHTPYVEDDNMWNIMRNYFKGEYQSLPQRDEINNKDLKDWWLYNLLQKKFFARRNTNELFHHIAMVCLADRWGDELLLGNLPIESMQFFYTSEFSPPKYVR